MSRTWWIPNQVLTVQCTIDCVCSMWMSVRICAILLCQVFDIAAHLGDCDLGYTFSPYHRRHHKSQLMHAMTRTNRFKSFFTCRYPQFCCKQMRPTVCNIRYSFNDPERMEAWDWAVCPWNWTSDLLYGQDISLSVSSVNSRGNGHWCNSIDCV